MAEKQLSIFERYLTAWVLLCIAGGIFLGKVVPDIATTLNDSSIYQVSIPIAVCLFFMMYPIMVRIDFTQVVKSAKTPKPVFLTLFINWAIKPFSMFATMFALSPQPDTILLHSAGRYQIQSAKIVVCNSLFLFGLFI